MSANYLIYRPEDEDDDRPFVEIIVARLGGQLRSHDTHYGRFYCIADWVHHVTGSTEKDRYKAWNSLKQEMERQHALDDGRIYVETKKFQSSKGQLIELDACDELGLYYIFQFIFQAEPTDTVKAVRKYLAMAGVGFDMLRRDVDSAIDFVIERYKALGKSDQWIQARITGKIARKQFMDALTIALIKIIGWEYGVATNTVYFALWGRTSPVLYEQLEVKQKPGNLRDNLPMIALSYLAIAESLCADLLGTKQSLEFNEADEVIKTVASAIGEQVQMTQKITGKDMITGWEILPEGDDYYEQKIDELGQRRVGNDGKFIQ